MNLHRDTPYVPQEPGFYDDLRVAEAIEFFGRLKGLRHFAAERPLTAVGLLGHERKRIRELSGGMKQRLALGIVGGVLTMVMSPIDGSLVKPSLSTATARNEADPSGRAGDRS